MLICRLYTFSDETSVQIIWLFLNQLFVFQTLSKPQQYQMPVDSSKHGILIKYHVDSSQRRQRICPSHEQPWRPWAEGAGSHIPSLPPQGSQRGKGLGVSWVASGQQRGVSNLTPVNIHREDWGDLLYQDRGDATNTRRFSRLAAGAELCGVSCIPGG